MTEWFKNLVRKIKKGFAVFFGGAGGSYTPVPTLEQACVLYYRMNDNKDSAVVRDESGNGYHGTAQQNTSALHTVGKVNGALTFNGTSDYVDTEQTFQSVFQNSFSISLWAKLYLNAIGNSEIFGVFNSENWHILRMFRDYSEDVFYFYYGNQSTYIMINLEDNAAPFGGQWVMITIIVEKTGSTCAGKFYINSEQVIDELENTADFDMSTIDFGANTFLIGKNQLWGGPIDGSLDDVSLFNRAITQEEIDFLWNGGNGREGFMLDNNLNTTGERLFCEVGV